MDEDAMKEAVETIIKEIYEFSPKRLVVDSISAITQTLGSAGTRQFLHVLFGRLVKDLGITSILVGEIPMGRSSTGFGVEEFIVDAVILLKYRKFRNIEKRELEIRKMRGVAIGRSVFEYMIDARHGGISLIALPEKTDIVQASNEKMTTGVRGLDRMMHGGVFRDSLTLVEGSAGIGKTTLCLQFLISNAQKGEKALFLSFEEPIGQIRRLLDGYNIDYKKLGDKFKAETYVPEALTPLQYYGLVRQALEDVTPTVLAIDSITAVQHTLRDEDFIEFMRYLQILCKERQLTVFVTAVLGSFDSSGSTGISSLADNIIVMRYYEMKDRMAREIVILKTRSSPHENRIMTFEITDRGMNIPILE
jgi:circadian clock protein KaiC